MIAHERSNHFFYRRRILKKAAQNFQSKILYRQDIPFAARHRDRPGGCAPTATLCSSRIGVVVTDFWRRASVDRQYPFVGGFAGIGRRAKNPMKSRPPRDGNHEKRISGEGLAIMRVIHAGFV